MANLNALMIFARVVEAGSFSGAATRLGMPVSTVSRRIAELEDELGVRLLERSTRNLRLTDVGSDIIEQAQRGLEISETVDAIASNRISKVKGLLRLSAPPSVGESLLAPLVCAFQASYPDVRVHIIVTDRYVDPIEDGVDLVFRVGKLKDSSMVARPLLRYRHRLVASPDYLSKNSPPKHPADLLEHRIFAFAFPAQETSWTFTNGRQTETIAFHPYIAMNDYNGLATALASGGGIGDLPPIVQPALIRDGNLVEVMQEWRFQTFEFSIVHLGNRHVSRALRVFKEFTAQLVPKLLDDLPV